MTHSMVRRAAVFTAALTVLAAGPVLAGSHDRTVTREYVSPGGVQGVISGSTTVQGAHYGFVELPTSRRDRWATVQVTDANGVPVAFELAQGDREDSASMAELGEFCSATPSAVRLPKAGQPLVVYVNAGVCAGGPSVPTSGTVTVQLR